MNIFLERDIADKYDDYYYTDFGKQVDIAEKEIISELLNKIPSENQILDIGCGTGHWTEFFIDKGYQVTGVDSSESMLSIAKSKNLDAEFILAKSENLPIENESFGIITTITMLEFVENQETSIQEMYRVLKKGGYLIVGGLFADSVLGMNKENDNVFKHANLYARSDLKSKLSPFNILQLKEGVYVNDKFEFVDSTSGSVKTLPLFFGLLLQKPQI